MFSWWRAENCLKHEAKNGPGWRSGVCQDHGVWCTSISKSFFFFLTWFQIQHAFESNNKPSNSASSVPNPVKSKAIHTTSCHISDVRVHINNCLWIHIFQTPSIAECGSRNNDVMCKAWSVDKSLACNSEWQEMHGASHGLCIRVCWLNTSKQLTGRSRRDCILFKFLCIYSWATYVQVRFLSWSSWRRAGKPDETLFLGWRD